MFSSSSESTVTALKSDDLDTMTWKLTTLKKLNKL